MTKVDWFSAIERGMAAAQAEKTKPYLKAVGPSGAGGDLYRNTNNINVLQEACPCPTTEILVGPDGEAERPSTKQAVTPCGPTCPNCPTTFDKPVEISRIALGNPAPRIVRDRRQNLIDDDATEAEIAFLLDADNPDAGDHTGKRVELNAMTSRQFIDLIERKLAEHGSGKVIPDEERTRYRRTARSGGQSPGVQVDRGTLVRWDRDACPCSARQSGRYRVVLHAFMRRAPCSRQDSAVSIRGEPCHPTVLLRNVAEVCCSIGNLAND